MAEIICDGKTTRDINTEIKRLIAAGETDIWMRNPVARHNLGVAILQSVKTDLRRECWLLLCGDG